MVKQKTKSKLVTYVQMHSKQIFKRERGEEKERKKKKRKEEEEEKNKNKKTEEREEGGGGGGGGEENSVTNKQQSVTTSNERQTSTLSKVDFRQSTAVPNDAYYPGHITTKTSAIILHNGSYRP